MEQVNLFCIIAKTGAGKSVYINSIFDDKNFCKKHNLSMLVYGTTRNKRVGEKEGTDYHYYTLEEYNEIAPSDLVEFRSYYTLDDGTVYYFTKREHLETGKNMICITSPYQYESFRNWCANQNLLGHKKYNLYLIYIDTDIKIRIRRLLDRAEQNHDDNKVLEMCRRVLQESNEFEDVSKNIPELIDPMLSTNVCYINNNSNETIDIGANINKVKMFIRRWINNE